MTLNCEKWLGQWDSLSSWLAVDVIRKEVFKESLCAFNVLIAYSSGGSGNRQ